MKSEIYNRSIDTRELQLTNFGDKVSHFSIVGYLLIFPTAIFCFHFIDIVQGNPLSFREGEILFVIIPVVLSIIAYVVQKQRLKYKVIRTKLKKERLKELIVEVAKDLDWERGSFSEKTYTSYTNPRWWSGSWGEQITILFSEDHVFINSICDLNKKSSVVSWGRNKRNENALIEKIKNANQSVEEQAELSSKNLL